MQWPMDNHIPPYNPHNSDPGDRLRRWEVDPDAPEQPSDALWGRIEADLPPPRRRRALLVWWWLAGAGLLLLGWHGLRQMPAPTPAPLAPPAEVGLQARAAASSEYCPGAVSGAPAAAAIASSSVAVSASPLVVATPASLSRAVVGIGPVAPPYAQVNPVIPAEPTAGELLATADGQADWSGAVVKDETKHEDEVNVGAEYTAVEPLAARPLALLPDRVLARQSKAIEYPNRGGQWWLSLYTAPASGNYVWESPAPAGAQPLRSRQNIAWEAEQGLRLRYQWAGGLSIGLGLSHYNGAFGSLSRFRRAYDPAGEQTNPAGEQVSTYGLNLSSPYGDTDLEVELRRGADQPAPAPTYLFFTVGSRQALASWQAPLQIGYHRQRNRWRLGLLTGPSWEVQQLSTLQTTLQVTAPGALRPLRPRVLRGQEDTRVSFLNWTGSLELGYRLAPRWEVYLQPFGQTSLTRLHEAADSRARRYGCQLGLSMKLN